VGGVPREQRFRGQVAYGDVPHVVMLVGEEPSYVAYKRRRT
jgi:hypothetical protein